jgi:hypothetical protein
VAVLLWLARPYQRAPILVAPPLARLSGLRLGIGKE